VIRRAIVIVVALTLVIGGVLTAGMFLWPKTSKPSRADAVVMFVGGKGERLDTALSLVRKGVAPNLVIPNGLRPTWPQANRLCNGSSSVKVWCPNPDPDTTRGESRAIAGLARQHGWRHLVLVTSTYHVSRARVLLRRCFGGRLDAVAADPDLTVPRHVLRITHEWAGMAEAVLVNRAC
jgi:uncharacterized SAM-binding protein YcdF (DUF218 family)